MNVKTRRLIFRLATVLVLIGICALMMVIGRGHTVYLDNKTLEYNGETYSAMNKVTVYVNGERIAKLAKRERGSSICIGQKFTMELEIVKEKGDEPVKETFTVKLPYNIDGVVINLPGYLAGLPEEAWRSEFVSLATDTSENAGMTDEEILGGDDMGLGGDF
ncbi:MAG: hypothetical protein Q4C53_03310 [Clostridia bacterium]|nr:hypothetical protein [Clostridia bacterium]